MKRMSERVIRPTLKLVKAGYLLTAIIVVAGIVAYEKYGATDEHPAWLPLFLLLLFLWPLSRHIRTRAIKLVLEGDRLRLERGFVSRDTRIIQIHKIQDVRVTQSLGQRMLGIGNLGIETAGAGSPERIPNIDQPQVIAHEILEAAGSLPAPVRPTDV